MIQLPLTRVMANDGFAQSKKPLLTVGERVANDFPVNNRMINQCGGYPMLKHTIALVALLVCVACCPPPTVQVVERTVIVVVTATPTYQPPIPPPPPAITPPTPTRTPTPTTSLPFSCVSWQDAGAYLNQGKCVCGAVVRTTYSPGTTGQPTYLDLGRAYPDPSRFSVVIWGNQRGNFPSAPETYYRNKTICVTGTIKDYRGTLEMEVRTPAQIQVR